ncbi:MAG: DUF814 domain-containing protein [Calditrichaeota bacterium]|nr:MAG: DUF814 domain-containing protein [Calditrichota bacterium]
MKIKKFATESGGEIWVGMDDASNDALSLKVADATDLWFHVAGFPGSHVLLRGADDRDSIRQAAAAAAWFSKMRKGKNVPVHYCYARQVSKPRKAKAGTVTIRGEKKIKVTPALPEHPLP